MQTLTNWVGVCFSLFVWVFVCLSECATVPSVCVCVPYCVCLFLCVLCLFVVCLCLCGLSCVALAHINVAQTLQNTIGSLTWLCHYLHSIFGYSPTVRCVQWGCLLFLHDLLIFMVSSKKELCFIYCAWNWQQETNARLIDDLSRGTLFFCTLPRRTLSLALFHLLHLFRRQRRALSLSYSASTRLGLLCLLCARLRLALDWTRRWRLRSASALAVKRCDCAASVVVSVGYSRSRFIAKHSQAELAYPLC